MTLPGWVQIAVALIGMVGLVWAARESRARSARPSVIDDSEKVRAMAVSMMTEMRSDLEAYRERVVYLEDRVDVLEKEVVRLGGDPSKLNGK